MLKQLQYVWNIYLIERPFDNFHVFLDILDIWVYQISESLLHSTFFI